jgi:hypothetical protein
MSPSKTSPLAILFVAALLAVVFSPGRAMLPQQEADAIRARFGISPGAVVVFQNPG